jgi:hypothetical protein
VRATLPFVILTGLALLLPGCGGGGPAGPSVPGTPTVPAGTVLTFESGETGQPVSGATVVIAGRNYRTSALGQVTLDQAVPAPSPLDALAAAFLERETYLSLPAPGSTRFTLWPRTSRTGLDESFTELLVYTDAVDPPPPDGSTPLTRVPRNAERVFLSLSPQLEDDPVAARLHRDYAVRISQATGNAVSYIVGDDAPGGDPLFAASIDPADRSCRRDVRAFTLVRTRGDEIVGGEVVYCSVAAARSSTVGHELGHTFGLNHSREASDLMYGFFSNQRSNRYSPREALVMRLMLQRRAGNRFPDSERDLGAGAAESAERIRTFVCG